MHYNSVLFMGRKSVAAKALEWLYHQENIKIYGVITDSHLSISPTREMALKLGIPILTRDMVENQILEKGVGFDLAVSLLYWQKIRTPILKSAKKGVVNFHPAPLPDYKGTAGYNLAILEGLDRWAVTAHYVDEDIDTGDIIKINSFDISREDETVDSIERKSQYYLFETFKEIVSLAIQTTDRLPSKQNIGGRYISRHEMESMKAIKEEDDIERKIRAFWYPPYDGAYIEIDGKKYTLVNRKILSEISPCSTNSLFTPKL